VDESLLVVDFMARGAFGLNAGAFHPIISCLARKNNMERSWRLIEIMAELGISPDRTTLNYLLTAYCFKGDLTAASGVVKRIEDEVLGVDSRAYDVPVLDACKKGKVEGALVVMECRCCIRHVINALLKQGYHDQAVKFVMVCGGKEEGLDSENFRILGSKLIEFERFKEAKLVLEEM
jgi:large subunit ribosomal protein L45